MTVNHTQIQVTNIYKGILHVVVFVVWSSSSCLGMIGSLDLDEFLENFQREVGVISDPKNYVADFLR